METLAALQSAPEARLIKHIDGTFLASPDMSVDRFRALTAHRSSRPDPVVVFSSAKDRILRLSSATHGGLDRLGSLTDPAILADRNVILVDLSDYPEGYVNHRVAFSAPRFLAELDDWKARPDRVGAALRVLTGE